MHETALIEVSKEEATEALAELQTLKELEPMEQAKLNVYDAIANDEKVIDLQALMNKAMGGNPSVRTTPVALAPVTADSVTLTVFRDAWGDNPRFEFSAGSWSYSTIEARDREDERLTATAVRPSIPVHIKPKVEDDDLILWEPVWQNVVETRSEPLDPAILRHLGGSMYKVVAAWDLTDLEARLLA
jgi:hypothetical protein